MGDDRGLGGRPEPRSAEIAVGGDRNLYDLVNELRQRSFPQELRVDNETAAQRGGRRLRR
jgi:hypothetical protein